MAEAMMPTGTEVESGSGRTPLSPDELAPHFPQLEILECLGRGGMGVVYKARQKTLNRLVALKLLAPERVSDADFARRFEQEAQALAALNHPNIVTVYDFGQAGGFYFLLMEFVDGVNLRQAMKVGRFTPQQALAVVPPVCEAMQCAHENGIVHRDIKPENLLLDKEGRIKIADFGIAKMLHSDSSDVGLAESQPAGTPQYMAPEQKEHAGADHRADIYSLGVVLYELLTGELPADKLQPPSRKVQVDVRLDEIVLRALESTPELRFQTAAELRTQVETMVKTPAPKSSPPPPSPAPGRSRLIKAGFSVLTTREQLGTLMGQFFCVKTRGQLILDEQQLTHSQGGVNTAIPLAAIRDLSIGNFPRGVNPVGLDLLCVTYEDGGQSKHALLSPQAGWLGFPATYNAGVNEWFRLIGDAATAASGREPTCTPPDRLNLPGTNPGMILLYLGIFIMALLPMVFFFGQRHSGLPGEPVSTGFALPGLQSLFPALGISAVGLGIFIWRLLRHRRAKPSASTPSKNRTGGLMMFAILGAPLLVGLVAFLGVSNFQPGPPGGPFHTPLQMGRVQVGRVVVVDLHALVIDGPVEMKVYLDGLGKPWVGTAQISSVALNTPTSSNGAIAVDAQMDVHDSHLSFGLEQHTDLIEPSLDRSAASVRVLTDGNHTWRVAFVLPNDSLARQAWEALRPMARLEVRADGRTAGELFQVTGAGGETYTGHYSAGPVQPHADARSDFPTGGHIGRNDHSVLVTHDNVDLHHVLYYAGRFGTSSSGNHNTATRNWVDEGSVRLKNGRSFGYRRTKLYPDELTLNGAKYDLRKGRVFILNDEGSIEQMSHPVPLSIAKDPTALGEFLARKNLDASALNE
ncbi:MAG: serine/threonine protein kinase [Yoonia sp.]|jgi:serine/threonine protein kinase